MRASNLIAAIIVLAMVVAGFGVAITNVSAVEGSEDSAGYFYTDSNSPAPSVAFNWVEIRSTGTNTGVYGDDVVGGPYSIGFDFIFYGTRYSAFNVSTNGLVMFGMSSTSYSNTYIPSTSFPSSFIAVQWDDLYANSGEIVYQTLGSAPNRQLVIEYYNVTRLGGSDLMTFEVLLNETSGDIWCQYLMLNGVTGSYASEGIENYDGTIGVQYGYNTGVLSDNLAVKYSQGPVTIGPDSTDSGRPSDTLSYSLTVVNRQLFADSFEITYDSALGWSVTLYDALMNPLSDTDGDTIPDTGTLPALSGVSIVVEVDIPGSPAGSVETTTMNASSHLNSLVFDTCILTSELLPAWLTPPYTDYGDDTDLDGDYNYLVLEVPFHVRVANWYNVYTIVHTSSDWAIASDSSWTYYSEGDHVAEMTFYGWLFRESGVDGPYHIHIELSDGWSTLFDSDIHTTDAYSYTEFMEVPVSFSSPFSDMGVDTDSDGLYDYLAVSIALDVNYDGRIILEGDLYDTYYWNNVGYDQVDTTLAAGSRTVTLIYDAWSISTNLVDGTFYVWMTLWAEVDGIELIMESTGYYTSSYDFEDFERPDAMFNPPHSEHTVDVTSNGAYDYLVIDVQVNVTVEGDYTIRGYMQNWWGDSLGTVSNTTHLAVGNHTVEIAFLGWPIYYYGEDGPYDVYLTLIGQGAIMDEDYYETYGYDWWEFDGLLGWFEAPHADSAIDDDADLLYDYLKVEVGVNVTIAGTYRITADLENSWGWVIQSLSNTTYLEAGWNSVEFWYTGWVIYDYGYDPYQVDVRLYDSAGRYVADDIIYTASYTYSDFEGVPAYLGWPHSSWAVDDDFDDDYDRLVVNATVEVVSAGTFQVVCTLYDFDWNWIGEAGASATLDVGTNVVEVEYDGWRLYANGVTGVYYIYIYLYDEDELYLDSDVITSASYEWDSFDGATPTIISPPADSPPTVDGVVGATEWADAVAVDLEDAFLPNDISGTMYVMNDEFTLYILLDMYGDVTDDESDYASVAFDTGNDDLATDGDEDEFILLGSYWSPQVHYEYSDASSGWVWHCQPFEEDGLLGSVGFGSSASLAASHRIYEFAIPLEIIGASHGDELGFIMESHYYDGVYDAFEGVHSSWPVYYSGSPELSQYGQLMLADFTPIPPPTTTAAVSGTAGTNGWYKSDVSVTLSATGGNGGVDYTQYRLDGGAWTTYSAAIAVAGDGTHTLEYRSADNTGQVESTKTLTVKIDKVLPVTVATVSGAHVWLNCTDATSGMASMMYRIDGGSWTACTGMITVTGEGTHTLEFYATDAAGNTEVAQTVAVEVEEADDDDGDVLGSGAMLWVGIGLLAAIAAIVVVLLMKRKKGQQPADMGPAAVSPMEPPPPQPPA